LVVQVILVIFLVLIAAGVLAQTDDDFDQTPADSLGGASNEGTDTSGVYNGGLEDEDVGGQGQRRFRRGERSAVAESLLTGTWASWLLNTHPDVNLSIDRKKDVTNWDTKINVNRRVSSKLSFSLGGTLHTQENSTLNRSDSNDGTSASLKYQLSDAIGFSLRYNSAVTAYRYNLKKAEPAERRRKQNVSVSADFSKDLTSALTVHLGTSAGTTQNSYASVSNQGSQQDLTASVVFAPMENLKTSVNYNAKRLLLDSQVDSSGTSVFASTDRTFSQDLGLSVKYDVVPGIKMSIDASQTDNEKQNPDPVRKRQETENRSSRRASLSTSFDLLPWAKWDAALDLGESRVGFLLQSDRDNFIRNASLKGSAKILAWRGATVNLGGTREETRSKYKTSDTGHDVHQSLTLRLAQDLGPKADLDLTTLTDLVSVFYDDKVENPKDRDRLNNRVSMGLSYAPLEWVKTKLAGEYSRDQTVYVRPERSANNRTDSRYRLSGDYDIQTFRKVTISQSYDISAVFSSYEYTKDSNTLVRNSNVTTQFLVPMSSNLSFNVGHNYQFQDQGKYSKRGGKGFYARSSEKETHSMSLACKYQPVRLINVVVKQTYRVQRTWTYAREQKSLDSELATSDISGRVNISYTIGDRTSISLKLEQNLKEGSNVSKAFRNYRNVELEASYAF
jgi:hypothetical protein